MFHSNKVKKFLAKGLILLFLMTNSVGSLASAQAAATASAETGSSATPAFSEKISGKDQAVEPSPTEQSSIDRSNNDRSITDRERELQFENSLLNYYLQKGKQKGPEWLRTTEFQFNFTQDHKPIYSLETLQPFDGMREDKPFWFWQGRYAHESENSSTANLGVGWRNLSQDQSSMIGFNMFYDYGFQYNLSRLGLGTEYFNKLTEWRLNYYHPLSGDRQTGVSYLTNGILTSYIRAVEGLDFETGTSFTHLPWLKIYAGGYYWDNKYNADEKGYRLRSTLQLTPRINMELGYNNSNYTHGLYGEIKYELADGFVPSLFGDERLAKIHSNDTDLSDKLMQKVERDNDIKTETYTKFVSYQGSIRTTVTNTNNGTPLVGVTVQAYQNGTAVGSAAITDASGSAVISGLNVGTYTVYATYGSYTGTSNVVTVTKDQTADASVHLAVQGGNASVTVVDANSQPLAGAHVTATLSSPTVAKADRSLVDRILGVKSVYAATGVITVTAPTNANGVASFTNLPPGTYTFTVNESGATMTSQAVGVESGGSDTVTILVPKSGGDIQVAAQDSVGTALQGVSVQVLSGGIIAATGKTDSNGKILLGGLPAGKYQVGGTLSGYDNAPVDCTVENAATATAVLKLTPQVGSVTVPVNFTDGATNITPVFTLDGTTKIIKPPGAPTISNGVVTYTFTGIPVGSHKIYVSAAGYDVITPIGYAPVDVTEGATIAASGITMAPDAPAPTPAPPQSPIINVQVIGASGGNITQQLQGANPITDHASITVAYNSSPSFTITADPAHRITSILLDQQSVPVTTQDLGGSQTLAILNVTSPHVIKVSFGAPRSTTITLTTENGSLFIGAAVTLTDANGHTTQVGHSDQNGQVTLDTTQLDDTGVTANVAFPGITQPISNLTLTQTQLPITLPSTVVTSPIAITYNNAVTFSDGQYSFQSTTQHPEMLDAPVFDNTTRWTTNSTVISFWPDDGNPIPHVYLADILNSTPPQQVPSTIRNLFAQPHVSSIQID